MMEKSYKIEYANVIFILNVYINRVIIYQYLESIGINYIRFVVAY